MACSQPADATTPAAKPAAPDATPPSNPPLHSTMSSVTESEAMASDHIEQERQPHGERGRNADRDRDAGVFAHRQELNSEYAQAQRHVQRERHDDSAFGKLDQRV